MVRVITGVQPPATPTTWWWRAGHGERILAVVEAVKVSQDTQPLDQNNTRFPVSCRSMYQQTQPFGIFLGDRPVDHSFAIILLELIFVILTIRLVSFLLKPLRQPRIVSEIIGGIIIGPSVVGRNRNFAEFAFPETTVYALRNFGLVGFMYFLFVSGVKMDLSLIKRAERKHFYVAFFSVFFPTVLVSLVGFLLQKYMDKELAKISSIGAIAAAMGITSFPVLYAVLTELNLLSSEVGKVAMSIAVISDAIGINAIVAFEAAKQGEGGGPMAALWYLISLGVLWFFMLTAIRRAMIWIVQHTPEGKPVEQGYVVAILLLVLIMGFLTDMFGIAIANGPLWLGLIIPDGPPLGATLVERSETIIMEIFMPFGFAFVGLYTDVFVMREAGWFSLAPLFAMAVTGYVSKLVGTLVPSLFYEMPLKDCLCLSLIMSLRGQVELILIMHWVDKLMIQQSGYTLMVLATVVVTAISTPLISILYDPTKPYMVTTKRTIQHTPPDTELCIVICIYEEENVAGLINVLEVSNPTQSNPFSVYAVHLIKLVGRANPVFIDHKKQNKPSKYTDYDSIYNALNFYQETREEFVHIHTFTAVAAETTMYQDICELALESKATLIILPFNKEHLNDLGGTELARHGVQSVNSKVLDHAPCSVGVLVDRGQYQNSFTGHSARCSSHHIIMLFLGGADAREALTYADRMAANPDVHLTVIRFLSHNYEGYDEVEKKLDDGVVTWFWVKNELNERVVYREMVVRNGEETAAAIQEMNDSTCDLWIMGRRQGINPVLLEGLSNWSEDHELGVIGDYVASNDFSGTASVLVVQQQVLRGQEISKGNPCNRSAFSTFSQCV